MNCIEHVFKLGKRSIKPSSANRTQELRDLLDALEKVAQNYPQQVFYDNRTWFYTENEQTRDNWEEIREMLEVLGIPVQNRELDLFGFYSVKFPGELLLGILIS